MLIEGEARAKTGRAWSFWARGDPVLLPGLGMGKAAAAGPESRIGRPGNQPGGERRRPSTPQPDRRRHADRQQAPLTRVYGNKGAGRRGPRPSLGAAEKASPRSRIARSTATTAVSERAMTQQRVPRLPLLREALLQMIAASKPAKQRQTRKQRPPPAPRPV